MFYDGTDAAVAVTVHAKVADLLGLFAQPSFVYYGNAENAGDPKGDEVGESNFYLQKWYAKVDVMDIDFRYGADSLWWNLYLEGDYQKRRTSLGSSERVLQGKIGALYDLSDTMRVPGSMGSKTWMT